MITVRDTDQILIKAFLVPFMNCRCHVLFSLYSSLSVNVHDLPGLLVEVLQKGSV